jgi:hypothetical protein
MNGKQPCVSATAPAVLRIAHLLHPRGTLTVELLGRSMSTPNAGMMHDSPGCEIVSQPAISIVAGVRTR